MTFPAVNAAVVAAVVVGGSRRRGESKISTQGGGRWEIRKRDELLWPYAVFQPDGFLLGVYWTRRGAQRAIRRAQSARTESGAA